jgi:hypothetical protein
VPVRGQPRNPFGQRPTRFHRLRAFGGDVVSVDTIGETPLRFHDPAHVFAAIPGESPGLSEHDRVTGVEAPGQVRRLWHQLISPIPPPPPVRVADAPFTGQRAIRYKTSSFYLPAGDQQRFSRDGIPGLHTIIVQATRQDRPTLTAGVRRNPPTVRNRITSFGSRVPPLNPRIRAAEQLGS